MCIRDRVLATAVNIEEWKAPAQLRGFLYYPVALNQDQDANLVMGLYVAQADDSVQHLTFHANKSLANDLMSARAFAASIAGTLAPGRKPLAMEPGDHPLFTTSSFSPLVTGYTQATASTSTAVGETLLVTMPAGYVITEQHGIDFSLSRIRKIGIFGQLNTGILVYWGDHAPAPDGSNNGNTVLLGKETQWNEKKITLKDGQTSLRDTALVTLLRSPSTVEVSIQAKDAAELGEMKKIASSLRFGKP